MSNEDQKIDRLNLIGDAFIEMFNLKANKHGKYKTNYGEKTKLGIGRTLDNIVRKSIEGDAGLYTWIESDNVIFNKEHKVYRTQCTLWRKVFKIDELKKYYKDEYAKQ